MLTQIGGDIGLLYCLLTLLFRWKLIVAKYGSLGLYWWVVAVAVGWSFLGFLADTALQGRSF
jgi:hypothetical protein